MSEPEKFNVFLPHGGYRKLRSYKVAEAVYDATVVFCRRFYAQDRRMTDQMVQAARSGVRNISEGSGMAATSRKSEMKLTNVARASLSDELLRDYETFLRQNGLRIWPKNSREALAMRQRLAQDIAPNICPKPRHELMAAWPYLGASFAWPVASWSTFSSAASMAFAPGAPAHLFRITPFGSMIKKDGVPAGFHLLPMTPVSTKERQFKFSFTITRLTLLASSLS